MAIMVYDREMRVEVWNTAAERLFGWSAAEAIGQPNPAHVVDRRLVGRLIGRVFGGETITGVTLEVKARDGRVIRGEMYASPVLGADGRAEAAFVILADIGEREALERQVREAHRMESVGYLAGGIAHQFNNLLTTIVGYSALAASTLDADHEAAGHLAEIQQASDRAADLTRRLLAFSRRQTMRPGVFDLALAVAALRPVLQRIAGPDVRLVLEASVTDRFDSMPISPSSSR